MPTRISTRKHERAAEEVLVDVPHIRAVWTLPTDLRMLSHFASSTSVLRSPNDPIVLLYIDCGVLQYSKEVRSGMAYLNDNILPLQFVLSFVLSIAQVHLNSGGSS